ncbi:FUSC family protein [Spirillospora sp. NBC_01491]|uniref:FUSC family protein n=1 Tax=Spirillospora sp. NBC_01491 TaxID=2976007 RepID=UPI002E3567E3|nr:FUSC family protein [Spirillospora sp. NBC_01491]
MTPVRQRIRPYAPAIVRTWARLLVALITSQALLALLGLGATAGYAALPAIFLALYQPAGPLGTRMRIITAGTLLAAALSVAGAAVAGTTWPLAAGLGICGLVLGFAPRLGSQAATLQLPLLTAYAYSAAHPLDGGSPWARGASIALSLPVLLLATASIAPPDPRRPLALGAARALGTLAGALADAARGEAEIDGQVEAALAEFQTFASRVKASALPYDDGEASRAALLLAVSVPRALSEAGRTARSAGPDERPALGEAARQAAALASGLGPADDRPLPGRLATPVRAGPAHVALVRDLNDVLAAAEVVRHRQGAELPRDQSLILPSRRERLRGGLTLADPVARRAVVLGAACFLAGLAGGLLRLGQIYWIVFAAVMILQTPPGRVRGRLGHRLAGTFAGVALAGVLVPWTADLQGVQGVLGLVLLLPALLLGVVNYGWTTLFVATAVGLLYAAMGESRTFFGDRLVDNLLGGCVIAVIIALTWPGRREDPWTRAAVRSLRGLAEAARSPDPRAWRADLAVRAMALRDAAADRTAEPGAASSMPLVWTIGSATGRLSELVTGTVRPDASLRWLGREADDLADGLSARPPATVRQAGDGAGRGTVRPGGDGAGPPQTDGTVRLGGDGALEFEVGRLRSAIGVLMGPESRAGARRSNSLGR